MRKNIPDANPEGSAPGDSSPADDFEARLVIFWQRHYRTVLVSVAVVCVAILGYEVVLYAVGRKEQAIQEAFQAASGNAALLAFAREHPTHSLAGVAYLQVAIDQYRNGEFIPASNSYRDAIDRLGDSVLTERARLGYGVASIRGGEEAIGVDILTALTLDESILDGTRAEAAYNLAVVHWKNRKIDEVGRQLDLIAGLETPGYWVNKADGLRTGIPELNRP